MQIAIPKETMFVEQRVALVPQLVQELTALDCSVLFERGAGLGANYPDNQYVNVQFYDDAKALYKNADIILKVHPPSEEEISLIKKNAIVIGLLAPTRYPDRVRAFCQNNITSFAMELIPRIARAQSMDALSSQAAVSGYKAALIAANMTNRFFPMLTTAAGTIRPSNLLVIGAGVAGLQAIATGRRLGAIVKAYDVRSAAKEQVESLGAKMIQFDVKADSSGGYARELTAEEKQKQQDVLTENLSKAEVVITTALIPGKIAPKIISQEMLEVMQPGTVIIDIAAEAGGNCALTMPDEVVTHQGVMIYGPTNLPSRLARDASNMYAKNLVNFLKLLLGKENNQSINWDDPILAESVLTHDGVIKNKALRELIEGNKT